ncbi:MAG: leucine-rich repeat protein [Muribaculaceae bacterium]|nr:leucine-rich repeat protein [Muribaculaceae bacterium]
MKKDFTNKTWLRRLWLAAGCLAMATAVQAASITVDGINYTTASGNKATVAKYTIVKASGTTPADTLFYTGDIVIPEKFTYEGAEYTVVATAANCFLDCKDVTSITLPATCVTIGRNSFKGCSGLRFSPIPETATNVGSGVFNGCTNLEEVTIMAGWSKPVSEEFANCPNLKRLIITEGPSAVVMKITAFGASAEARTAINSIEYIYMGRNVDASAYLNNEQPFHNMGALKTLVIGGETTTIQGTTFQGCTALQTVTFEEGNKVTGIGNSAFASCTSLTGIDIPVAVTVIEQSTFNGCRNLSNITMGDAVTSIGITAFYNTALTSFTFPSALTTINQSAFENSQLAGDIVLPASLTAIGSQAFAGTRLTGVTIPASVTSIGQGAFAPIPTLANITLVEGNTAFKLDNGVLLNAAGTRLLVSAHEGEIGTSYSNATVTSIDNYGLAYAPFTSVDLPALATVGNYGFAYSDLEAYTLDKDVTVGQNVFAGSALKTIVIGEGRNEIPQGLCAGCTSLTDVTLPSTTTNMMRNCFEGCTALAFMEIPANVNYMEPGSVPATIQELRVLNVNPPALAAGVFNEDQGNVICKVAPSSVEAFKGTNQWRYLNITGDETISGEGSTLGCPTGLYFATTNGSLMYKDENGNIVNTNFNAGQHAFTLQSYKNRVYVAVAGQRFTYQDPNQPLGDGELFYVNNTNGIFYRVTVLNNVGYAPSEDPFTMFIDEKENKIYISDRNVGIHEMNADTTGLYGQQPFLLQNQWLPYYNDEISWGSITGGFTQDKHGIFWMSKKFNGLCLLRFKKNDIYPEGGQGKPKHYNALFKDAIIKTFYLDEENGYLYMQVQTDPYGCVPGIYRIALNKIENMETGADVAGNADLRIADCELIDDSPIKVEGAQDSGEIACVAQINSDGENIYWSYIAPSSDEEAINKSVPLDVNNPLHHSGIKCLRAKANEDGTMPTTVTFAVEGVEAYGVCGATYVEPQPAPRPGDVNEDGEVNIADVNVLINMILTSTSTSLGDVNHDGEVNIADVNVLIDMILSA